MAQLHIDGKDTAFEVKEKPIIIGRSSKSDITMSDNHFSRHHFEIGKNEDGYYVKDLNSFNGTLLNDKKITQHLIKDSDIITVGKTRFIFTCKEEESSSVSPGAFVLVGKPGKWRQKIPLKTGVNTLGRKKHNDICLSDDQVSSAHAEIHVDSTGYKLQDLGSRNGTIVNSKRIQPNKMYRIHHGDTLQLGTNFCLLQVPKAKKKTKTVRKTQALMPIVFSVLFVSLFAIVYFLQRNLQDNSFIPGNLIDNFSFEENSSWNYKSATRVEGKAKTGKYLLRLNQAEEIKYWDSIAIEYGKHYLVSCWLRYQNISGQIAVKISWKCENEASYTIETYTPFVSGTANNWEELSKTMVPPQYAKSFQVSIIGHGEVSNVEVDHFTIIAIDETAQDVQQNVVENVYRKIQMEPTGNVNAYRKNKFVFGSANFKIWQGDKIVLDQTFCGGKTSNQQGQLIWEHKNIHVSYQIVEDGIEISYTFPQEFRDSEIECSFLISTAYTSEMQVIKNTEVFLANIDNFSQQAGVRQIVWQEQQLGFIYSHSGVASIENTANSLVLAQRFKDIPQQKLSIKVKTNYEKDREKLLELKKLAEQDKERGLLGKAYAHYQKMLGNFFVYEYKISPQNEIERLVKFFEKDQEQAQLLLEKAQFFKQHSKYERCIAFCQNIYTKWQGVDMITELDKIMDSAKNEQRNLHLQQTQQQIEVLVARAENFATSQQENLAILSYRRALALAQDSKLQNDLNNKINKLKQVAGE
ncbi:FHA domain-containing protein [Candidatus Uabimicrobium amorphum]|uniref:ABC transporter ATP-binding protein n=1 Tax=Uabimicrobium amorphum TaxID=2596890 RepID=A0A5S9IKD5_UABAM|nr:FHA domain-containing protein [Candidatus Uabimicrobium amorphum]BBM82972.1 ABC transporter ATP-binding protein [Candidatus Uabimicrobium amorphum]